MTKLYVGNLAWTVTDQDLTDAFSGFGEVERANVVLDRETRQSRGFGFVSFVSAEDAEKAIKQLNGSSIKGREIRVSVAQAKSNNSSRTTGGYRERQQEY